MRFKASRDNLVVLLEREELDECLRKIVASLVPRFAKRVYVSAEPAELVVAAPRGARVVLSGQVPSNFLASFRVIVRPGEVVVVAGRERRFSKEQWREVAEHVGA
jgi:CBS-domain-containing membrane protein